MNILAQISKGESKILEFKGNILPYYLKKDAKNSGTYIRIGATNRLASFDNIIELQRQRNNISYDEELNYDVDFNVLDLSSIYKQFKEQNKDIGATCKFNHFQVPDFSLNYNSRLKK